MRPGWGHAETSREDVGNEYGPPASPAGRATTVELFAKPSQTLIFFDWDDTLFPTTEVFDRWGVSSQKASWSDLVLSAKQQEQLDEWQVAAYQYLSTARGLSERCVVVTNALRPWVQDTVDRFAPRLAPLFDWGPPVSSSGADGGSADDDAGGSPLLRVVYAREAMTRHDEQHRPGSPFDRRSVTEDEHHERLTAWKFAAMRREVRDFYTRYPGQSWKNVLSIGDGRYERDALQEVAFRRKSPSRERLRTKVIVLWPEPSISDITIRLQKSQILLPAYVRFDGDIDVDLSVLRADAQHPLADALGLPELRDVAPVRGDAAVDTLDGDLVEIAVAVQSSLER